jgi:phospho-N-acetylmuramoyl-pentapeptide-transferase
VNDINPWLLAIISSVISGGLFAAYRWLVGRHMQQCFREDGPAHHKQKGAVPTGAGIILVILLIIAGAVAFPYAEQGAPNARIGIYVCWAAALMGLLGWIDDRRKVLYGTAGLRARFKFPVQILVGLALLYLISTYFADWQAALALTNAKLPWPVYAPWWIYYPVGLFVWLGAVNGANFTDGLDGLLSVTTLFVLAGSFFALLDGVEPLSLPAAVGFGVLAAFLVFNWKPALLYMGDSGSLAVGALVAGLFLARGWWLFLGLAVFVWVIEVLSVMAQVISYRTTGRRILLMSPLHHHFELAGWGERTTVFAFLGLQILGCTAAFVWLRYGVMKGVICTVLLILLLALLLAMYHKRVR